jgi:hypothetical protein
MENILVRKVSTIATAKVLPHPPKIIELLY